MSTHVAPAEDACFEPFNIRSQPYKIVNGQEIDLHVLLPKNVHTGRRPILIHFHGGFLMAGHAMFPDWAAQWALSYQLHHSAIRISANYRLLPESNGLEILSDVRDLLNWIQSDLSQYLKRIGSDITPDLEKILVYGESAGGYLAIQSGLMRPDLIKAIIAAYPMTYLDSDWYAKASTDKSPGGMPQIPRQVLDEHIANITPGTIFTGAFPSARVQMAMTALQNGLFPRFLGMDDELYPARVWKKKSGEEKMPYLWILHGKGDTFVPCDESVRFLKEWQEKFGKESAMGEFREGEHGFDGTTSLEDEWMERGLSRVTRAWIG